MILLNRCLYKIFIQIFYLIVKIISLFNIKAKKWIKGRKNPNNLKFKLRDLNKKLIWMHVSSLGEYEQGVVLLEELNKKKSIKLQFLFFLLQDMK